MLLKALYRCVKYYNIDKIIILSGLSRTGNRRESHPAQRFPQSYIFERVGTLLKRVV